MHLHNICEVATTDEDDERWDGQGRAEAELLEDLSIDGVEDDERQDHRRAQKKSPTTVPRSALVFVNMEMLRPRERSALQEVLGVPVFDRFMVVLQIFQSRAQSPEAKLRLALAENSRRRTMLVDAVAHHAQQRGGTGALPPPLSPVLTVQTCCMDRCPALLHGPAAPVPCAVQAS